MLSQTHTFPLVFLKTKMTRACHPTLWFAQWPSGQKEGLMSEYQILTFLLWKQIDWSFWTLGSLLFNCILCFNPFLSVYYMFSNSYSAFQWSLCLIIFRSDNEFLWYRTESIKFWFRYAEFGSLLFFTKSSWLCSFVSVLVPMKRNFLHCVQLLITWQLQLCEFSIPAVISELTFSVEFSFRIVTYVSFCLGSNKVYRGRTELEVLFHSSCHILVIDYFWVK